MKTTVRVIDLHKYALENTNIKLDRSILYKFQGEGLHLIQNQGWKYLEFSNLENVVATTTDNDLFNWYLVFDFYIINQEKIQKEQKLQKQLDMQIANLMVKSWAAGFNPARGFQRFKN